MLEKAFEKVTHFSQEHGTSHRVSALALGVREVADVKGTRGLFP